MADPADLAQVAAEIDRDPRLNAELIDEQAFYLRQSRERAQLIEAFAYLVCAIMAVGAVIAAYTTMQAAVRARQLEIATLRALGFFAAPVMLSVLLEAVVLSLIGGLLGGGLVYLAYDGYAASTMTGSLSPVAFEFSVTRELVGAGLLGALGLGLAGASFPSLKAARGSIAEALRSG